MPGEFWDTLPRSRGDATVSGERARVIRAWNYSYGRTVSKKDRTFEERVNAQSFSRVVRTARLSDAKFFLSRPSPGSSIDDEKALPPSSRFAYSSGAARRQPPLRYTYPRIYPRYSHRESPAITGAYRDGVPRATPLLPPRPKGVRARYSKRYGVCTLSSHLLVSMVIRRGVAPPRRRVAPPPRTGLIVDRRRVYTQRRRAVSAHTATIHKRQNASYFFTYTQRSLALGARGRVRNFIVYLPFLSACVRSSLCPPSPLPHREAALRLLSRGKRRNNVTWGRAMRENARLRRSILRGGAP